MDASASREVQPICILNFDDLALNLFFMQVKDKMVMFHSGGVRMKQIDEEQLFVNKGARNEWVQIVLEGDQ